MSGNLSAEQLRRIEENRQKAIQKRARKPQVLSTDARTENSNKKSATGCSSTSTALYIPPAQLSKWDYLKEGKDVHINCNLSENNVKGNEELEVQDRSQVFALPSQITSGGKEISNISGGFGRVNSATVKQGAQQGLQAVHINVKLNIVPKSQEPRASSNFVKTCSDDETRGGNFYETKTTETSVASHKAVCHTQMAISKNENVFVNFGDAPVKGTCVLIARDRFEVIVGYSAPLIQLFKSMETKLYDAVKKKWSFKLSEYSSLMSMVRNLKPTVDIEPLPQGILTAFTTQFIGESPLREIPTADLSRVEQSLVNSLMSFQREGVNFGISKNGRVLIADDMGLGKTIQAICLACYYRNEWPLLVVVPSSIRFDWQQHFRKYVPALDPQSINVVVTGTESCTSGQVNIISYDIMAKNGRILKEKRFQVVIMDECHLLKNYKTARCKAAMPILQNARRVILLSGTPALSRPNELFTQIIAVCPSLFKFHDFGVRYCDGKQMPWGWDYTGSSNMEELQLLLEEKVMIRRLKKDVMKELPDKIRQMVLLDPNSVKITKDLKSASKMLSSLNFKKQEVRSHLLEFFHKSGTAKIKAMKSYVEDLLEGEHKLLVFAHHTDVLDGIEAAVKSKIGSNYIRIDGKTNSEQRHFFCRKFQFNDEIRVAILSITAANAGLDLSAANLVVFAELFWNPGILTQAEDRAHRIGQQDVVCVQYLVAAGTSDDYLWPMIQQKLDVLGKAGLIKDDFSSAETTRLLDKRQEEIAKFLEESFCHNNERAEPGDTAALTMTPVKVMKQQSILMYTSPQKNLFAPSNQKSVHKASQAAPQGLFKYFSSSRKPDNDITSHSLKSSDEPLNGCVNGQGPSVKLDYCDNSFEDLEELLKDSDDEWILNDVEPEAKKRKTDF